MPSLADYADLLDALAHQGFDIKADRCISVRNRNVVCNACAQACASGCISIHEQHISIDPQVCIGCGTCATACPTGAIRAKNPDDQEILDEMSQVATVNEGTVVIACAAILDKAGSRINPDSVVKVACLGRIDESLLLTGMARFAEKIVLVGSDCASCPHAHAAYTISTVVRGAQSLLEAWGRPGRIKLAGKFPRRCALGQQERQPYDFRRREFMLGFKDVAKTSGKEALGFMTSRVLGVSSGQTEGLPGEAYVGAAGAAGATGAGGGTAGVGADGGTASPTVTAGLATAVGHVGQDGTLRHFAPQRLLEIGTALDQIGLPGTDAGSAGVSAAGTPSVSARMFRQAVINPDLCTGCQMCAVFCPTAALAKRIHPGKNAGKELKLYRSPGNSRGGQAVKAPSGPAAGETVGIVNDPARCVGCKTCLNVCKSGALTLSDSIDIPTLTSGYGPEVPLRSIYEEKGGPNAIRNSMSKLISGSVWG